MLNWTKTKMLRSEKHLVVSTTLSTLQEGMAIVSDVEGGVMKCRPSDGATTGLKGKLIGIAMSPRKTFGNTLASVTITTPSSGGTVLLPNTVSSTSDVGVFVASSGVQLAATTSSASSTNIQVGTDSTTGLTSLTFDSTSYSLGGGVTLNVYYNYAMAPAVEVGLYGNPNPGFTANDMLGMVSVFKIGRIATNCFDPQANWYTGTNAPSVKVIAGGLFTDSASSSAGFVATNVNIIAFPTPSEPWLELDINA